MSGRDWRKLLKPSINHIHQQMHTVQLKSVHNTPTYFGSEASFSQPQIKRCKGAIYQLVKCNAMITYLESYNNTMI